jgi:hypothetical protein
MMAEYNGAFGMGRADVDKYQELAGMFGLKPYWPEWPGTGGATTGSSRCVPEGAGSARLTYATAW